MRIRLGNINWNIKLKKNLKFSCQSKIAFLVITFKRAHKVMMLVWNYFQVVICILE